MSETTIVHLTPRDAANLLDRAQREQRKATHGGGTWQFWTRLVTALTEAPTIETDA